ncbi:MAG: GNAT family N-acetyltransferase [Pseudomonas sp.]
MRDALVRIADWQATPALRSIRQQVFIEEQAVPAELEWDDNDDVATHFLLTLQDRAVGTARLLSNGHIGRVALLPEARSKGLGKVLMKEVMQHAWQSGFQTLELSAQTHALGFYQRLGFTVCSDIYLDAGIPHQTMRCPAPSSSAPNC